MIMKSVLFSRFDPTSSKSFEEDLKILLNMSKEQRSLFLEHYHKIRLTQSETEERQTIRKLAKKAELADFDIKSALNVFDFFLRVILGTLDDEEFIEDTPELWALDLISKGLLTESEKPTFVESLEYLQDKIVPTIGPTIRARSYSAGVLPVLVGLTTTVELRAVQKQEYTQGQKADDYIPQIVDLVPVASIRIEVNKGTPKDFFFQVDEGDVNHLNNSFKALKKEIDELKKRKLGLNEHVEES